MAGRGITEAEVDEACAVRHVTVHEQAGDRRAGDVIVIRSTLRSGRRLKVVVSADDEQFVITLADQDRRIGSMGGMVVEYDTEVAAFYVRVREVQVARTVEVSVFLSVDLDADEEVVGLELLCLPSAVTADERAVLEARFPVAIAALTEVERLTRLSA